VYPGFLRSEVLLPPIGGTSLVQNASVDAPGACCAPLRSPCFPITRVYGVDKTDEWEAGQAYGCRSTLLNLVPDFGPKMGFNLSYMC